MSQEKHIGMDVHQATISVAVRDVQGKLIMECMLETKAPPPPGDRVAGGHRELAHYRAPFCAPGLLSLVWGRREHLAFADSRTRQSS